MKRKPIDPEVIMSHVRSYPYPAGIQVWAEVDEDGGVQVSFRSGGEQLPEDLTRAQLEQVGQSEEVVWSWARIAPLVLRLDMQEALDAITLSIENVLRNLALSHEVLDRRKITAAMQAKQSAADERRMFEPRPEPKPGELGAVCNLAGRRMKVVKVHSDGHGFVLRDVGR